MTDERLIKEFSGHFDDIYTYIISEINLNVIETVTQVYINRYYIKSFCELLSLDHFAAITVMAGFEPTSLNIGIVGLVIRDRNFEF